MRRSQSLSRLTTLESDLWAMGRPRGFDMEEAIGTATTLFWRGYDRTSLTDLTGALGVGPASFYFAFSSKEALFRECVERYVAAREEAFEAAFQAFTSRGAVEALLRGYVDVVTDPSHAPGCLVVNSSPSTDVSDALRTWLAEHRKALRLRLEQRFLADVADAGIDTKAMARFVATLAGGLAVEAGSGATRQELYDAIAIAMAAFPEIKIEEGTGRNG